MCKITYVVFLARVVACLTGCSVAVALTLTTLLVASFTGASVGMSDCASLFYVKKTQFEDELERLGVGFNK